MRIKQTLCLLALCLALAAPALAGDTLPGDAMPANMERYIACYHNTEQDTYWLHAQIPIDPLTVEAKLAALGLADTVRWPAALLENAKCVRRSLNLRMTLQSPEEATALLGEPDRTLPSSGTMLWLPEDPLDVPAQGVTLSYQEPDGGTVVFTILVGDVPDIVSEFTAPQTRGELLHTKAGLAVETHALEAGGRTQRWLYCVEEDGPSQPLVAYVVYSTDLTQEELLEYAHSM